MTVYFQVRGLPHAHGVFWLKEDVVSKYKDENGDYDDNKVVELIDEYISVSVNTDDNDLNEVVKKVQRHCHTKSCQKYKTKCRFNFPRFPSNRTFIAKPLPSDLTKEEKKKKLEKARNTLERVRDELESKTEKYLEDNTIEDLLASLKISEVDYYNALKISEKGKVVILKRELDEIYINNYNPLYLTAWQGNIDIQFCLDTYGVVTYITDYLSKDESGLTEVLQAALAETKDCNDFERLNRLKKVFFTHRQMCLSEAAYKLIAGLNLKGSNIKTKFVPTGFPTNRTVFMKKLDDGEEVDNHKIEEYFQNQEISDEAPQDAENEVENPSGGKVYKIKGRKGTFFMSVTPHVRYSLRPPALEALCFAQFVTSYDVPSSVPKDIEFIDNVSTDEGNIEHFQTGESLPQYIKLSDASEAIMKLRTYPYILRIHSSEKKPGYEKFYAELQLYHPWRDEEKDLCLKSAEQCIRKYQEHLEEIKQNKAKVFPYSKQVDDMKEIIESNEVERPTHVYDTIDQSAQQQDDDDRNDLEPLDTSELPEEIPSVVKNADGCKFKPIEQKEEADMISDIQKLSLEQRIVCDKIIGFCKDVVMSTNSKLDWMPEAPQLIVHGKIA